MTFSIYFIKRAVSRFSGFSLNAVLALCAFLCLAGGYAHAQNSGQGTVSGTVTDPSGAVVVGAEVTVTNSATNVSHSRVTNSTGYFEVDNINPGTYAVSVAAREVPEAGTARNHAGYGCASQHPPAAPTR